MFKTMFTDEMSQQAEASLPPARLALPHDARPIGAAKRVLTIQNS